MTRAVCIADKKIDATQIRRVDGLYPVHGTNLQASVSLQTCPLIVHAKGQREKLLATAPCLYAYARNRYERHVGAITPVLIYTISAVDLTKQV